MEDQEAIDKMRECKPLCYHLAELERGGVELSEVDHQVFQGFREVYHWFVELDLTRGAAGSKAGEGERGGAIRRAGGGGRAEPR